MLTTRSLCAAVLSTLLTAGCGEDATGVAPALMVASEALASTERAPSRTVVYVGSHDSGDPSTATGQIAVYALDLHSGALTWTSAVARDDQNLLDHPTFMAFDWKHMRLFAVSENYFDPTSFQSAVASFAVDRHTGALQLVSSRATGYSFDPFEFTLGAVHLGLDPAANHLLVAIFDTGSGGGAVQTYPVASDGTLGALTHELSVGSQPHQVVFSRAGTNVFVPEKGTDRVEAFSYDGATGALTPRPDAGVTTPAGAGPRHLAFSLDQKFAYLVSEDAATLSVYRVKDQQLIEPALATLSTVPSGVPKFDRARAAEVAVDGFGLVYVSTRFDALQADGTYTPLPGTISAYRQRGSDGTLSLSHANPVGKEPRHFSIDPTGRFLVVANQGSDSVVSYRVEGASGRLHEASSVTISHPEYAGAVLLP